MLRPSHSKVLTGQLVRWAWCSLFTRGYSFPHISAESLPRSFYWIWLQPWTQVLVVNSAAFIDSSPSCESVWKHGFIHMLVLILKLGPSYITWPILLLKILELKSAGYCYQIYLKIYEFYLDVLNSLFLTAFRQQNCVMYIHTYPLYRLNYKK